MSTLSADGCGSSACKQNITLFCKNIFLNCKYLFVLLRLNVFCSETELELCLFGLFFENLTSDQK